MNKLSTSLFLVLLVVYSLSLRAQTSKVDSFFTHTPIFIQGSFHTGKVIPTNDFVRGQNFSHDTIDQYKSFSLLLLKQTTGDKLWEQLYSYPVYGIGFYSAFFKETNELGTPISVFGYFSAPFARAKKLNFNYELGLGLTFNWKNFDPLNNPNNIAISAERSVYIEAGVNLEYQLSKKLFASAGYGLYHFSNGHLKLPNQGLNMQALKFNLRYQVNKVSYSFIKNPVPEFNKHWEWDISFFGGAENVIYSGNDVDIITKYQGLYFPVYGINNTFSRSISYKSKIGAGFSIGYNGALNAQLAVENGQLDEVDLPFGNHITLSVYPSYELVIDRLSIILQPGFYLYRKKTTELTPFFYQRIGVKYHFWNNYFAGISLRAYKYHVSDFIEWNIGRRIKW
ncbi:MAG TPA: acyloxyacyl hydrolase [Draconibacterium sp.]|nr:acyloxyacyl hydrolase [Draconibacterium sp.]